MSIVISVPVCALPPPGALYSLFDFISALLEVRALQRVLLPTLTELIYHLLSYMMISEAQVGGAGQSATPPHTLL